VLADDVHSDWLLWEEPQLAGRIGYDVRFELLSTRRLATLFAFREDGTHRSIAAPYRVLTFASGRKAAGWQSGRRTVFRGRGLVVLTRT
jgi:hypothetical protein